VAEAAATLDHFAFRITTDLGPLFNQVGPDCSIAIDIPIGLPEREPRACDAAARQLLGWPRRNSVFSPPARRAICASTFPGALRLNRAALDRGISMQTYCIMPKIREVDELMTAETQRHVREAHPEVTFARLSGSPMIHNKKRPDGRAERIAVLQNAGIDISNARLAEERHKLGAGEVTPDDLLDALACLITALHVSVGRSQSLGLADQRDGRGLLMEIVTCSVAARSAMA
jgi:predicted RNase H-like nuclease